MSDLLLSLVRSNKWDSIREKLASKDEADVALTSNYENSNSGFRLFEALCLNDETPSDIIISFAERNSNYISHNQFGNDNGPLHLACGIGFSGSGSSDFVKKLLSIEYGYRKNTLMAHQVNDDGRKPLEIVWAVHFFPEYENYIDFDTIEDEAGVGRRISLLLKKWNSVNSPKDLSFAMEESWKMTMYILYADQNWGIEFSPLRQWYVLHEIARSGRTNGGDDCDCPGMALWAAIKLYPNQISLKDDNGDLPLHIAASNPPLRPLSIDDSILSILSMEAKGILKDTMESSIQMLLKRYPRAASIHNKACRLPLHLAAERGASWELELDALVAAAPKAIDTRDIQTHLYPFMLAAVKHDERKNVGYDRTYTNSIYMLLRKNPNNVRSALVKSSYEKYLERKILEVTNELNEQREIIANLKKRKR